MGQSTTPLTGTTEASDATATARDQPAPAKVYHKRDMDRRLGSLTALREDLGLIIDQTLNGTEHQDNARRWLDSAVAHLEHVLLTARQQAPDEPMPETETPEAAARAILREIEKQQPWLIQHWIDQHSLFSAHVPFGLRHLLLAEDWRYSNEHPAQQQADAELHAQILAWLDRLRSAGVDGLSSPTVADNTHG